MSAKTKHVHESKTLTSATDTTLQIPVWGKIHGMSLQFASAAGVVATEAQIRAQIGNIRVSIGGKDILNASATRIFDLYEVLGVNVSAPGSVAGVMELNIGRLLYTDPAARNLMGWGTLDVSSLQITITAGTLDANIAAVQAFTSRENIKQNLGAYCKFINYPQTFNAAADHSVDTLPRDTDSDYLLVMVDDGASGTISHGECRANNNIQQERIPSAVNALNLSNDRMAQPSGYYVYGFADGSLGSKLEMPGITDLRFINTFIVAPGAAGYNIAPLTLHNFPRQA
jgi:hypothetical protein